MSSFEKLKDFLLKKMRMAHVYQPVMIAELLKRGGSASSAEIANALLSHDQSQIDYYQEIVRDMVGRVLTKNHEITVRQGKTYSLNGFEGLSAEQQQELISICQLKIDEYVGRRGDAIWSHRNLAIGDISGTIRYEVLKRARFRCELCGTSAEDRALEVDHILPRSHGGSDEIANFQALCFRCNAMKGDRDATDFRKMAESYIVREKECIFCEVPKERIVAENELAFAVRDGFPVTELHTLILPKRHCPEYFGLYQPELNAINQLIHSLRKSILEIDHTVTSFNIGANAGVDAGQTVMHCHIHLIPRRTADTENPQGGVRGVIPGKQRY